MAYSIVRSVNGCGYLKDGVCDAHGHCRRVLSTLKPPSDRLAGLQVAQMPRSLKVVVLVLTMTTMTVTYKTITLPFMHAHGVTIFWLSKIDVC